MYNIFNIMSRNFDTKKGDSHPFGLGLFMKNFTTNDANINE